MLNHYSLPVFFFASLLALSSCRKDIIDTDSSLRLQFSTDTLTFDTVFTTLGSTTLYFKVYNPNKNAVKTDVQLAGGDASNFRLNIDGITGNTYQDLEIFGKDSTYIFVEVTVDINNQNTPFVIYDSVLFMTNGNRQKVILEAWGQDAYFYRDSILCNEVWNNDKPHVILNAAAVDSGCTLTINAGTQVYMGGNAQLIVLPTARIIVNGTKEDTVVFQGIRLEDFYDDLPGQWSSIFILRGSTGNSFNHAVIKNANFGLHIGYPLPADSCGDFIAGFSFSNRPVVNISNSIIKNSFINGLFSVLSEVTAENCLLYNSGDNLVSLGFGGIYNLNHCTIVNYGSPAINHQKAAFFISNLINCNNTPVPAELFVSVENTIIYGSLDEELNFSYADITFDAIFNNCLLKTERVSDDTLQFNDVILNQDPLFTKREDNDYTLKEDSPCRDAGKPTPVSTDLNNNPRDPVTPDIGAYEFQ